MKNKFIATIGGGYWGKNLIRNLDELKSLVGFYDTSKIVREEISKKYPSIKAYNTIEELFNDPDVSGVFIATPAITHGNLAVQALNAGKHVFIEKPMCLDVEEAKNLIKLSKELDLKLMVGHLLLYHPAFIALNNIVNDNKLGKLRYIYSTRLSLGKFRKEENALWSFAPHDISMILSLVKEEPIKVEAFGGNYLEDSVADTTVTLIKFPSNIRAHIFVSWLHPYKDQRLVVIGEKAMAVFQDTAISSEKLMLYKHKASWNGDLPVIEKAEGEPIKYDINAEPLKAECEAFINLIKFNKSVPSSGEEGLSVLKVLKEADKNMKERDNND